ncbi:nucleotide-binding universal stress UspA family protein [Krasilnikovia cinnamomea]|uniref:Nucleotide-binding universal stress UspA family protein n=1 Tax=Krasilnikovia cinnamomea TaxID=349313 RepID=A0A4Q7ZTN1_9ACTN|nr:universal stress protein [Krasilnikovia cinnamomea]RZU54597.1 nucleotide-binding universal stress UspA family protein [Krasilnikovia cinnamomea]
MVATVAAGVGGAGGWQTLAWAAEQAGYQTGMRLELLRVAEPGSPLAGLAGEPAPALLELADPALSRALSATRTQLGGHRVHLRIQVGDPGTALAAASAGADLLVIGSGGDGHTVRRIVHHARCPVVVVRPVSAGRGAPLAGHVVVGVDGSAAGRAALEFGFAYADEHRLPVAAAHVSARTADDFFSDEVTVSPHGATEPPALQLLGAEVEPWMLRYPRSRVRRAVLNGRVADGLRRAGLGAHLLVVGDKHRGLLARTRTGDVPLTVARRAGCPVAVVPIGQAEFDRTGFGQAEFDQGEGELP